MWRPHVALDAEMSRRIEHHQARRCPDWGLVVARSIWPMPCAARGARRLPAGRLPDAVAVESSFCRPSAPGRSRRDSFDCPRLAGATQALIDLLPRLPGRVILVSNEVGWGIVPMAAVSRLFADEQGRLNQRVAAVCERVTLVAPACR
jgi:adenosylcobinamide kinase/adenosylcobinamide-phosphate guanylyltransferase